MFAVIGRNDVQYTHGTNFAERAYGIPERLVSTPDALRVHIGDEAPYTLGVDQ